jgi:hypothetical protein
MTVSLAVTSSLEVTSSQEETLSTVMTSSLVMMVMTFKNLLELTPTFLEFFKTVSRAF